MIKICKLGRYSALLKVVRDATNTFYCWQSLIEVNAFLWKTKLTKLIELGHIFKTLTCK
jgi:hypothetical protein